MRRFVAVFALLLATLAAPAAAQGHASVAVALTPSRTEGPTAEVRLIGLLDDPTWLRSVQTLAVRLEWRVKLWRHGTLWPSAGPEVTWQETITHDQLYETYTVATEVPHQPRQVTVFNSIDSLRVFLARPTTLSGFGPDRSGDWFYRAALHVSTLTPDEIAELQRYSDPTSRDGDGLRKQLERALMNMTLPTLDLGSDSPTFRWK